MTHNQIEFWKLNETRRSNYANEVIKQMQYEEDKRSNIANEMIQEARNLETQRANKAQESLRQLDLQLQKSIAQLQASTSRYNTDVNAALRRSELGIKQGELKVAQARVANESLQTSLKKWQWPIEYETAVARKKLAQKEADWYEANQVLGVLGSVVKTASAAIPMLLM